MTVAPSRSPVPDNIRRFRDDLERECIRLGRNRDEITIVAVSKTFPPDAVTSAAECGIGHFGESRVQEAKEKLPLVAVIPKPTWHLVGHLQTNKAKDAVALFDVIQSVDSWHIADEINRRASVLGKRQDVLLQVNTSGEDQKSGCDPWDVDELIEDIAPMEHIRITGLMTIGPLTDDEEDVSSAFRDLRTTFDRLKSSDLRAGQMIHCSMGMSDDWRIALAEGANMLRIGRAIFGERK